jgi:hypothetical protein
VEAALNRKHRSGLPAVSVEEGQTVLWRGLYARWTHEEKRMVAGLPAPELAVLHELKARLDAVLVPRNGERNK